MDKDILIKKLAQNHSLATMKNMFFDINTQMDINIWCDFLQEVQANQSDFFSRLMY